MKSPHTATSPKVSPSPLMFVSRLKDAYEKHREKQMKELKRRERAYKTCKRIGHAWHHQTVSPTYCERCFSVLPDWWAR